MVRGQGSEGMMVFRRDYYIYFILFVYFTIARQNLVISGKILNARSKEKSLFALASL